VRPTEAQYKQPFIDIDAVNGGGVIASSDYAPSRVGMIPIQLSERVFYVKGMLGVATDNEGFIYP